MTGRAGFFLIGALALLLTAAAQSLNLEGLKLERLPPEGAQVERGAALYETHCAVCHGKTGLGFAEAREAFPEDHRRCEGCHKRGNPAQMTLEAMAPNNAFSVGEPPSLRGEGSLRAFPNALALHGYIQATMPRFEPGRLSDAEAWDITAFLLELGGTLPAGVVLDETSAALLPLVTP